ncbi:MAG: viroplasmin family protein, partial [Patescibacteria group bacterium]|nr:viroplasmin family protein [Patescibacteria group bacterium]
KKNKSRSKAKAYSYLSMIDGIIMKHKSWEECEKRVKGKSGAKFKKALSAEEEEQIEKEWME